MRTVNPHLLENKMDEDVSHYINSHHNAGGVHIDANTLSLSVQDDGSNRVVTVMHPHAYQTSQICRQISVGEQVGDGPWSEELLETEGNIAELAAQLAQQTRALHHEMSSHQKITSIRGSDPGVLLDTPLRIFNGQTMGQQHDSLVLGVASQLPPLPTLHQGIKARCQDNGWFNKTKNGLKDDTHLLVDPERSVLDIAASSSPAHNKQNKKSLPHKKRISRKLKRNTGGSTPQQQQHEIKLLVDCNSQEEILPDNFVARVQHAGQMSQDTHHITHEVRPIFICQLCGEFYGEEQLKFYQHLKHHYELHGTIIIENPVSDLGIDKMTNTCIVDNVAILPDSIVELSLENTLPKTSIYQPVDKHIMYTGSEKTLNYNSNKVQYSMASMEKESLQAEGDKELYDNLEKVEFSCTRCHKTFKKQKQCEAHIKEVHNRMTNTCIVDNGAILPDSIVELSLENTLPKTSIYQAVDKHIMYTASEKTLNYNSNKVQYSMASMEKESLQAEGDKELYENLEKVEFSCTRCHKTFKKQKQCEAHIKEVHNRQQEEMSEFSEPEDLMEGIHVTVDDTGEQYELLPVDNTHPHDHSMRHWYGAEERSPCEGCGVCAGREQPPLKEEVFQRIFDGEIDVPNPDSQTFTNEIIPEEEDLQQPEPSAEDNQPTEDQPRQEERQEDNTEQPSQEIEEQDSETKPHMSKSKIFHCTLCPKVFMHRNSLKYHSMWHRGVKPHVCEECGKHFFTSSALKAHTRMHNGDRPYECIDCGRKFRQYGDLKYHYESLHSQAKPFKCDLCNKEFSRKYSLSVHRRVHTGEKNYKCTYCLKTFRTASYRQSHMRCHTGDKPHKCTQCDKAFRVKADMRRHLLTHDKHKKQTKPAKAQDKSIDIEQKTEENEQKVITVNKNQKSKPVLVKKEKAKSKKGAKKAPNVTITTRDSELTALKSEFTNNVEVFDTRQLNNHYKIKDIYIDSREEFKDKATLRSDHNRSLATLKPLYKADLATSSDKQVFVINRSENTDGKLTVFTQVEKNNQLVNGTQQMISDSVKNLDIRERHDLNADSIEQGLFDRFSNFYNIPAV